MNSKSTPYFFSFVLALFFTFPSLNGQCIVINEILVDGASCDGSCNPNTAEWIELFNMCGTPVSLDCWALTDGDFALTFPPGTTIPAGGYFTLGGATNEGSSPDLNWGTCGCANYYGTGGLGTFTNGGEQVALFDNSGAFVDGLMWSGGQGLPSSGNSAPAVGACSGQTVNMPGTSDPNWEVHPTDGGNDCTLARSNDGSNTWEERCGTGRSFGATNGGPLPIVFAEELNARIDQNNVLLTWSTAEEIAFDQFKIERRSSDQLQFELIGSVTGLGDFTSGTSSYSFVDLAPGTGHFEYRLLLVDQDGQVDRSKVEVVYFGALESFIPGVYPNPSQGLVSIDLSGVEHAQFRLMDLTGKLAYDYQLEGLEIKNIDLSKIPAGLYIYSIEAEGAVSSGKLRLE